MFESTAKLGNGPIFVVGSPRSGTSILTWCLGQHPNILPLEESDWLGEFAVDVGVRYRLGQMRGERSQLSSLGVVDEEFFRVFGDGIDGLIHRHRQELEHRSQLSGERNPAQVKAGIRISKSGTDPKSRWIDGTPEYSLYICGLAKLFPDARFVHIARDVRSVVRSMLNFEATGHSAIVATEQEAYEYWLKTVQACMQAEQALGAQRVYRLRYDDLVGRPARTIHDVLQFLDEPFAEECLEPLGHRINSSKVPADFRATDTKTDADVIERAQRLSEQLQRPFEAIPPTRSELDRFEAEFEERVTFKAALAAEYGSAQEKVAKLTRGLNWCGVILITLLMLTATTELMEAIAGERQATALNLICLVSVMTGAGIYAVIRREGLHNLATRVLRGKAGNDASSDKSSRFGRGTKSRQVVSGDLKASAKRVAGPK